jgi:hypothetical protein
LSIKWRESFQKLSANVFLYHLAMSLSRGWLSGTQEISIPSPRRFVNANELHVLERLYRSLYSLKLGGGTQSFFRI